MGRGKSTVAAHRDKNHRQQRASQKYSIKKRFWANSIHNFTNEIIHTHLMPYTQAVLYLYYITGSAWHCLPIHSIRSVAHACSLAASLCGPRRRRRIRLFYGVDFMIAHNNSSFIGQNNVSRVRVHLRRPELLSPLRPARAHTLYGCFCGRYHFAHAI